MDRLPDNWVLITLKDVTKSVKGKKPMQLSENEFSNSLPYMDIKALEHNIVRQYADIASSKSFEKGDVAMVWDGARSGWVSKTNYGAIGSTIVAIKAIKLNTDYLFYYLLDKYPYINSNARGVGIPHVDPTVLWNLEFPLAPLSEQQRIVTKLDLLYSQLDTIKNSLNGIPGLLKNFRQQVLTQAVNGKLTEEWREGKDLEEWKIFEIKDLCYSITDGDHQAPPQVEIGVPFLVISNVSKGYIDFKKVTRFVSPEYYANLKETRRPRKNDILYTVTGSFGISLLIENEQEFCFQRHIAILKPNTEIILPEYLNIFLQSSSALTQAKNVATGTAQLTVPLNGLRMFVMNLPPLHEQQEIVSRVENLFSKAYVIKTQYDALKEKIDKLPQAILHKAFKGELTNQLDSDGDAADLLKEVAISKSQSQQKLKRKLNENKKGLDFKV
jgi:type I restriction enzyme S subunit